MIPKSERDADKAICEAATQGRWAGFETGVLVGSAWVVSNHPDSRGCIMRQVDAKAIVNAVNRLPIYIAALDEMERRIKAVDALMKKYENEGSASAVAQEYDHANNLFERRDALFAALRILLRNHCTLCNGAGILQNPEDGWRPGLVLSPEAEACVRAAFAGESAPLPAEKWVPCKRCGGTTEAT